MTDLEKFCRVLDDLGIKYSHLNMRRRIYIEIISGSVETDYLQFEFTKDGSYLRVD